MSDDSHPAFERSWWINIYPNGQMTGTLCRSREEAENRAATDAQQIEVRIVPVEKQP